MSREKLERMLRTTVKMVGVFIKALPDKTPGKAELTKLANKLKEDIG